MSVKQRATSYVNFQYSSLKCKNHMWLQSVKGNISGCFLHVLGGIHWTIIHYVSGLCTVTGMQQLVLLVISMKCVRKAIHLYTKIMVSGTLYVYIIICIELSYESKIVDECFIRVF